MEKLSFNNKILFTHPSVKEPTEDMGKGRTFPNKAGR